MDEIPQAEFLYLTSSVGYADTSLKEGGKTNH